jgi:hypothetical protein
LLTQAFKYFLVLDDFDQRVLGNGVVRFSYLHHANHARFDPGEDASVREQLTHKSIKFHIKQPIIYGHTVLAAHCLAYLTQSEVKNYEDCNDDNVHIFPSFLPFSHNKITSNSKDISSPVSLNLKSSYKLFNLIFICVKHLWAFKYIIGLFTLRGNMWSVHINSKLRYLLYIFSFPILEFNTMTIFDTKYQDMSLRSQ